MLVLALRRLVCHPGRAESALGTGNGRFCSPGPREAVRREKASWQPGGPGKQHLSFCHAGWKGAEVLLPRERNWEVIKRGWSFGDTVCHLYTDPGPTP